MTTKVIGTSLMILLLVMGALFSGLPIYATTTEGGDSGGGSSDEGGGSSDEGTESEPETKSEPEPDTVEPQPTETPTEPQPKTEEPAPGEADTTTPTELPKCDGTPQDCTTRNGDICKAGEGGEKCECLPDMSDCPNHPSLTNPPITPKTQEPIHPCLLNPADPSCPKPDPITGDCPEGYAQNEDGNCFLRHPEGCPQGYHGHEDDETGRCIPNSTPCDPGYEFNKGHTNCERPHFTCDGKPSVVECKDKDKHKDRDGKRNQVIKHFHDTKIINRIIESTDDLDVAQTIVAISYDEGAGINCVISEDNQGQCETFDVSKDIGKEPFLAVIPFS